MYRDFSHSRSKQVKIDPPPYCRRNCETLVFETFENILKTSCPTEKSSPEKRLSQFTSLCVLCFFACFTRKFFFFLFSWLLLFFSLSRKPSLPLALSSSSNFQHISSPPLPKSLSLSLFLFTLSRAHFPSISFLFSFPFFLYDFQIYRHVCKCSQYVCNLLDFYPRRIDLGKKISGIVE